WPIKATATMYVVGGQVGTVGIHRIRRTRHQRAVDIRMCESDCVSPFVTYGARHLIKCCHVRRIEHHVGFDQRYNVGVGLLIHLAAVAAGAGVILSDARLSRFPPPSTLTAPAPIG